jgi:hypothetical protein
MCSRLPASFVLKLMEKQLKDRIYLSRRELVQSDTAGNDNESRVLSCARSELGCLHGPWDAARRHSVDEGTGSISLGMPKAISLVALRAMASPPIRGGEPENVAWGERDIPLAQITCLEVSAIISQFPRPRANLLHRDSLSQGPTKPSASNLRKIRAPKFMPCGLL